VNGRSPVKSTDCSRFAPLPLWQHLKLSTTFPSKNNIPLCATLHLDLGLFSLVHSQQHTSQLTSSILLNASHLSALAIGFSIPRQPRLSDRPCFLYLLGTRQKLQSSEPIKQATSPSEQNKEQDSLVVWPSQPIHSPQNNHDSFHSSPRRLRCL
jgi:hypothetical protein